MKTIVTETLGNSVINTRTQNEYNALVQLFKDNNYKWAFWRMPPNSENYSCFWNISKEKTCIEILPYMEIACRDINYFLDEKYVIISFDYFMNSTFLEYRTKEMTVQQIEKELGHKVKIIG